MKTDLWMVWNDGGTVEAFLAAFYGSFETKPQAQAMIDREYEERGGPRTLRPVRVTVHLEE